MSEVTYTPEERQAICNEINRRIADLESQGAFVCSQVRHAICIQVEAAADRVKRNRMNGAGVGDLTVDAQAVLEKARQTVSPWLWIFSLASFGMAVLNTSRIKRMYQKFKARTA